MRGQREPLVEDVEPAVFDDHGDDLATMNMAEVDIHPATMGPPWLEATR